MAQEPNHSKPLVSESRSEETQDSSVHAQVEVDEVEETSVESLAVEQSQPSVSEEVLVNTQEGSGDSGDKGEQTDVSVRDIVSREPRVKLMEATKADMSLTTARKLAHEQQEGYHWREGLLFRMRLDALGDTCVYRHHTDRGASL